MSDECCICNKCGGIVESHGDYYCSKCSESSEQKVIGYALMRGHWYGDRTAKGVWQKTVVMALAEDTGKRCGGDSVVALMDGGVVEAIDTTRNDKIRELVDVCFDCGVWHNRAMGEGAGWALDFARKEWRAACYKRENILKELGIK